MFDQPQIHQDQQVLGWEFNSQNSIEQKADYFYFAGYNQLFVILFPVNPKITPTKFKIDTKISHIWKEIHFPFHHHFFCIVGQLVMSPLLSPSESKDYCIGWNYPPPSNSHHQDYYIFSRESL